MALPSPSESGALRGHAFEAGWWFQAKEEIVAAFLRPHLQDRSSVLVLACGGGSTVRHLRRQAPACRVFGLDIDPEAIAQCAAEDPAGTYSLVDVERELPAPPGGVDIVIALDILEHLEDDEGALQRVAEALRPGGLLVVNVPAHPWLFSAHDVQLGHVRRYRPAAIEALVRRQGLELLHATPLFMTTLVLLAGWRPLTHLSRRLSSRSDVRRRVPFVIDRALYAIARAEGCLAGARLPFGSSHLLLARKPT